MPLGAGAHASLSHVFVHVRSLADSHRFYVESLGLEVLDGGPDAGYMRLGGGGGFTMGIEERPGEEVGSIGLEIVIAVDDVDRRYAELVAQGVSFDLPPADQEWGARHAWLRDPSGYRLSIYSPNAEPGEPG